jgi:DNA polymerase III delta prime subunit
MAESSQEQQFGNVDLTNSKLVSVNAGENAIVDSPGAQIIRQSYWSLFGDRTTAPGIDWDWAMRILKQQQPDIKKRLKDSLFGGLAEVDTVEMESKRQEESPSLALEAKKILTVNGNDAGTIDPESPIIATYAREDIDGSLLILGTPGAGKTITLLKLAEQLVGEAIAQPQTVIPIIFELSTWRDGQEIEAWLIEQLYENYGGNRKRKIYETWVERRVLLPLLDGLDELGMVRQKACTEKVNEFAAQYRRVVVCCRVKEFQQAGVNLSNLRGKVQLQPLNDRQIATYLQQMGKIGLWEQIQSLPEMGQLLESVTDPENPDYEPGLLRVPLFISLAAKVYEQDKPLEGKADLLNRYIDRQLSFDVRMGDRDRKEFNGRKWAYKLISDEPNRHQTQTYIRWLSQKILDAEITEFQLKWIRYGITYDEISYGQRPSEIPEPCKIHWLDTKNQLSMYRFIYRSIILLLLIIVNSIYPKFLFDLILIIIFNVISFITMISMGLLTGLSINSISQFLSKKSARENLVAMFKFTLLNPVKRIFKESDSNYLLSISYVVLLSSFIVFLSEPAIEYLTKTFSSAIKIFFVNLVRDNLFLATSLVGNGIMTFPGGLLIQLFNENSILETASLAVKTDGYEEEEEEEEEEEKVHKPSAELVLFIFILYNQAIYLFGLIVFVGPPLRIEFPELVFFPSLPILFLMVLFGIPGTIFNIDLLIQVQFWQHLPRRLILYLNGTIPWNLARFLTYGHERRLLQQIGGRYRFIHRELLEHFAGIEN